MEIHNLDDFVGEVQRQTGLAPAQGLRLIRRVLGSLNEVLVEDELTTLRGCLPAALQAALSARAGRATSSVDRLFARVQRLEFARRPVAIERTEIVCRLLGAMLPADVVLRWTRDLPAPVAALFLATVPAGLPADVPAPRPAPPRRPPPVSTLATGRPSSDHPVSSARPERAQRQSVVRADEPHADTKLSSSRGLTQERLHETLAEGAAGSDLPLAEARPAPGPKP